MEKLATFLNENSFKKVLDVGTGAGNFIGLIQSIYTNFDEIIGIDTIERAVITARKNFAEEDKISFKLMDALLMDFPDNTFDLVCLSNSLHHLSDIKRIMSEMERVLKPGGYILISEMINNDLDVKQQSHLKVHHFAAKIDRLLGDTHNDTFSDKEIISILNDNSKYSVADSWFVEIERRKENSKEELEWFDNTIDRVVSRVLDPIVKPEYLEEAEEIKKYINKHGFDSCTTLIAVIKK